MAKPHVPGRAQAAGQPAAQKLPQWRKQQEFTLESEKVSSSPFDVLTCLLIEIYIVLVFCLISILKMC